MGSLPKKNGHCTPEAIQDSSWFEGNHAVGSGAYIYPMAHSIRGNKIYTYMPHTNQEGKFTSPMAVWVSISRSTAFGIFDSKLVSSRYYLEGKGFLPNPFEWWVLTDFKVELSLVVYVTLGQAPAIKHVFLLCVYICVWLDCFSGFGVDVCRYLTSFGDKMI